MNVTTVSFLFASAVLIGSTTIACGGSSSTSGPGTAADGFALVAPAAGPVALPSKNAGKPISGFIFENHGSSDIGLSKIEVLLTTGDVLHAPADLALPKGGSAITFLFDAKVTHEVSKLSFTVDGSSEELQISETDETGAVPGPQEK